MVLERRLDLGAPLKTSPLEGRRTRFRPLLCAVLALALGCASASGPQPRKRTVLLSEGDAAEPGAAAAARREPPILATRNDDERAGQEAAKEVAAELGLLGDAALDAYVTRIGEALLRGVPRRSFRYRFAVVDQVEPNAFALPGGYVFVSRGLLALVDSEDELANVIGHEITHAASRHAAAQQAVARAQNPLTMPWIRVANMAAYSRDMERDADRGGQLLAAAAGYDPMGMSTFVASLDRLQRLEAGPSRGPSFFDTHPGTVERAGMNAVRANEIRWTRDPSLGDTHASYLRAVEGLPVGPRPEGGVFEGSRFLHPGLGFQVRFPDGWRMENSNRAVGAMSPLRDAVVYLTADLPPGELRKVAEDFVAQATGGRARVRDARPVKLGTLDAWRIELDAPSLQGATFVLSTFFSYRDATWRITGLSPSIVAAKHRGTFLATTRSFRPITREQAARVSAMHLHVAQARAGEDLEALCQRTGSDWKPVRVAIANGLDPTHRFAGGEAVKIALRSGA